MSEHNYAGLLFKHQLEKNPEIFDLTGLDEKINATTKAAQERNAANDLARNTARGVNTPKAIYNKLRKELYDLQEQAKSTETRVNNCAADVREFQSRVDILCLAKKAATAAGQLGEERGIEHRITMVEDELLDSREKLVKLQRDNHSAVRSLKDWQTANGAEFERLAKEIVG